MEDGYSHSNIDPHRTLIDSTTPEKKPLQASFTTRPSSPRRIDLYHQLLQGTPQFEGF